MGRTAREFSREELRAFRPWQAFEAHVRDPAIGERRKQAWKTARAVAEMLRREYGATRVVVFGSLALKTAFTPWSDIDLAVWSIKPERYFSAAGAAMDMGLDSGIQVDIVDVESCPKAFEADIESDGIEI